MKNKNELARIKRHKRVRRKMFGDKNKPRLSIHRSHGNLYAQFVDDFNGKSICSISTLNPEVKKKIRYGGNIKAAEVLGEAAASLAKSKGIKKVVFDRGGYLYHGRIKAFADSVRKSGLTF